MAHYYSSLKKFPVNNGYAKHEYRDVYDDDHPPLSWPEKRNLYVMNVDTGIEDRVERRGDRVTFPLFRMVMFDGRTFRAAYAHVLSHGDNHVSIDVWHQRPYPPDMVAYLSLIHI